MPRVHRRYGVFLSLPGKGPYALRVFVCLFLGGGMFGGRGGAEAEINGRECECECECELLKQFPV